MFLLADITTACSTTVSPDPLDHPIQVLVTHPPVICTKVRSDACTSLRWTGSAFQPQPLRPRPPCWPAGLTQLCTHRPGHRFLQAQIKAEHTQGSTRSDAFSMKTMSSPKAAAMTTKSEQRLLDRLRMKSWEGSGVCLTLVLLCFRWKAKPQKGKAGRGNNRTV